MSIPWELIASFAVGLALVCFTGYLLLVPMRFLWRLLAGGVLGALALLAVNFVGGFFGFSISINPYTAMAVGFLGLPGAVLVVLLQSLLCLLQISLLMLLLSIGLTKKQLPLLIK